MCLFVFWLFVPHRALAVDVIGLTLLHYIDLEQLKKSFLQMSLLQLHQHDENSAQL